MSATFVAEAHAESSTAGTTLVINVPTGTADGDVMVLFFHVLGSTPVTTPSGWTQQDFFLDDAGTGGAWSFTRQASSEPSSYTVTSSSGQRSGMILTYRGIGSITPDDMAHGTIANTTSINSPSVTTTAANDMVVRAVLTSGNGASTTWASSTERNDFSIALGSRPGGSSADKVVVGIGATGTEAVTFSLITHGASFAVALLAGAPAPISGASSATTSATLGITASSILSLSGSAASSGAFSFSVPRPISLDPATAAATGSLTLSAKTSLPLASAAAIASGALAITAATQTALAPSSAVATGVLFPRVISPGLPVFINSATGSSQTTTLTLPKPPGTANGDVMIAVVISSTDPTGPVDWSTESGPSVAGLFVRVFTKGPTTSEPNSYTFGSGGGTPVIGGIATFYGIGNILRVGRSTTGGTSSSQNSGIDLTGVRDEMLIISISGEELLTSASDSYTWSGATEAFDASVTNGSTAGFALTLAYDLLVRGPNTSTLGISNTSGLSKRYLAARLSFQPQVPYFSPLAAATSTATWTGNLVGPTPQSLTLSGSAVATGTLTMKAAGSLVLTGAGSSSGTVILRTTLQRRLLIL